MTLVLAIRHADGVVVVSDGQATCEASGQPVRQPMRKLFATVSGRVAWGAAGSVGLTQQLARRLEDVDDDAGDLVAAVHDVQATAYDRHLELPGEPPPLSALFAWPDRILTVSPSGEHQEHERWAAIGSGDLFAAYAMAAADHLTLSAHGAGPATLVATAAVSDAIAVAALFIGPPIQAMAVDASGAGPCPVPDLTAWREAQCGALGLQPSLMATIRALR